MAGCDHVAPGHRRSRGQCLFCVCRADLHDRLPPEQIQYPLRGAYARPDENARSRGPARPRTSGRENSARRVRAPSRTNSEQRGNPAAPTSLPAQETTHTTSTASAETPLIAHNFTDERLIGFLMLSLGAVADSLSSFHRRRVRFGFLCGRAGHRRHDQRQTPPEHACLRPAQWCLECVARRVVRPCEHPLCGHP